MDENGFIPDARRLALHRVVLYLRQKYKGVFGQETIEAIVFDSYRQMAAKAKITEWLVATAEKLTGERLDALLRAEGRSPKDVPAVLFLCTHNAGRSQMALGWFTHLGQGRAIGWSGGSEPGTELNKVAIEAMAEVGIDISARLPEALDHGGLGWGRRGRDHGLRRRVPAHTGQALRGLGCTGPGGSASRSRPADPRGNRTAGARPAPPPEGRGPVGGRSRPSQRKPPRRRAGSGFRLRSCLALPRSILPRHRARAA